MTIREILNLAKVSPLGSYALKDDDETMLILLNFALSQVYNKIPVLTEIQHIHLVGGKTRYEYLSNAYRVITATTECERVIVINDDTDALAIFDVGNHVLDIPLCVQETTNSILLLLQMKPPVITCSNIDTTEFTPDDALVSPILLHMAYMVSTNIGEESGVGRLQEFNESINEIKRLGMYNPYNHSNNVIFKSGGWV